jgi:hypothetical protein
VDCPERNHFSNRHSDKTGYWHKITAGKTSVKLRYLIIDINNISATFDSSLDDIRNRRSPLVCIRHSVIFDLTVSLDGKRKVAEQGPV